MGTRKYELRRRAERQAETRRRIVEAVVALHREIGPARTTITAIAERAGVERLTVYRHFGDETALFAACSAHHRAEAQPPQPEAWTGVADPVERLRAALLAFYGYYGREEDMLANIQRDAPRLPALEAVLAPSREFVQGVREGLLAQWPAPGRARPELAAAIGHALRFETWQSLTRSEGLGDAEAADLMVGLARVAAASAPGPG
ncbi:MAG TPA: TetR family transcriptional regulator [Longimicrobiales bacterium]|nr:TetR family transcriptional regulator [Longimicrobiales bacterium]